MDTNRSETKKDKPIKPPIEWAIQQTQHRLIQTIRESQLGAGISRMILQELLDQLVKEERQIIQQYQSQNADGKPT